LPARSAAASWWRSRVEDLSEVPDGLRVRIRRRKTDHSGEGHEIAIPRGYRLKPVEAVQRWLAAAENASGPLFRRIDAQERVVDTPLTAQVAALQVKRRALLGTAALRPALSCPARWRWPTSCRASR
jgi:hypothetical protein